jgi:hypothetical protein
VDIDTESNGCLSLVSTPNLEKSQTIREGTPMYGVRLAEKSNPVAGVAPGAKLEALRAEHGLAGRNGLTAVAACVGHDACSSSEAPGPPMLQTCLRISGRTSRRVQSSATTTPALPHPGQYRSSCALTTPPRRGHCRRKARRSSGSRTRTGGTSRNPDTGSESARVPRQEDRVHSLRCSRIPSFSFLPSWLCLNFQHRACQHRTCAM